MQLMDAQFILTILIILLLLSIAITDNNTYVDPNTPIYITIGAG
jgi:hypothetical protein